MSAPKYVLVRVDSPRADGDTGGDFLEIADSLKQMTVCAACNIEAQARFCVAIYAQKLGRRLKRLIDRANERSESTFERDSLVAELVLQALGVANVHARGSEREIGECLRQLAWIAQRVKEAK